MKLLKKILISALLLTSVSSADNYTSEGTYPLLTDMKMAKKEQLLLNNMHALIADRQNNNREKLIEQKRIFTAIIKGLTEGDSRLGIQGTKLQFLKNKISIIQLSWQHEKSILDSAINNKMYEKDAYETIEKLHASLTELNKLYKQSYTRYKKNSAMKSLVSSYMKKDGGLITEPMYAMNITK